MIWLSVGGVLPREQDILASAKIGKEQLWRLRWRACDWSTLIISYPWADACHPDRFGELLKTMLPIFRIMLDTAQFELASFGFGSAHNAIGVMLDYTYLPQRPRAGPAEQSKFDSGIRTLNRWYSHPYTNVLLATAPLTDSRYSSTRPYDQRGWCDFEMKASSLVKDSQCLWDLSSFQGGVHISHLRGTMRWGRQPPLNPDAFEQQLRARLTAGSLAFTYPKQDADLAVRLYRDGFTQQFSNIADFSPGEPVIYYDDLDWGDDEAETLAASLTYMVTHQCCPPVPILLEGNAFSAASKQMLLEASRGIIELAL